MRSRREDGAVAAMTGLLALSLLVVAAFVTDFGMAYANKRALQNGADAAALAIAAQAAEQAGPLANCEAMRSLVNGGATFATTAEAAFDQNVRADDAALEPGTSGRGFTATCEPYGLLVSTQGAQTSPSFLGNLVRGGGYDLTKQAKALVAASRPMALRPFGVCSADAAEMAKEVPPAGSGIYKARTVVFDDKPSGKDEPSSPCGGANGSWGLLNLDSGGGGRGGGKTGCEGIKGWILCGFFGTIPNPKALDGQGGSWGSAQDGNLMSLDGLEFPIPVYDSVGRKSGTAFYNVTGFIVVKVCGFDTATKASEATATQLPKSACFDSTEWDSAKVAAAANFGDKDANLTFFQFIYTKSITIGEINTGCKLGDPCSFGARVVKLAD